MDSHRSNRKILVAFTLIEVLVSMVVLAILIVLITSLFDGAQRTSGQSLRQMSADTQARLVFDRMGDDFNRMLKRKDVDYVFTKVTSGNDGMFFFSQSPGSVDDVDPAATHTMTSLVGYRVNSSFQLERMGKLLNWDGTATGNTVPGGPVFLTFPNGAPLPASTPNPVSTPDPASTINGIWNSGGSGLLGNAANSYVDGTDTDYHVLADGVFRFAFCFLEDRTTDGVTTSAYTNLPGSLPDDPLDTTSLPLGTYPFDFTTTTGTTTTSVHVIAIVVALGILDPMSRLNGTPTQQTVQALPNSTLPMITGWNKQLASGFASTSGLPKPTAEQVRVYQRTFYLNLPPAGTLQ